MPTHQRGYVFKANGAWYVRYREYAYQPDGSLKCVRIAHRLGTTAEFRTKSEAQTLAAEFLAPINAGAQTSESTMTIKKFVEERYFPAKKEEIRASTLSSYHVMWNRYLAAEIGHVRLRDFRTWNGQLVLKTIATKFDLGKASIKHIKNFMSGIFRTARQQGVLNSPNPMHEVGLPKVRDGKETYAYSVEEVTRMLAVLPDPAATMVAVAAFTGMRRSELRGLRWEDIHDGAIYVSRSIWQTIVDEPKTVKSKAPIPIIGPLQKVLDGYRTRAGNPASGYVFVNTIGTPLDPNEVRKSMQKIFTSAGIRWEGWHAFRRGLGTNLNRLGVGDKTIQAILRHSNISTTMNVYVKSVQEDSIAAMEKLGAAIEGSQKGVIN